MDTKLHTPWRLGKANLKQHEGSHVGIHDKRGYIVAEVQQDVEAIDGPASAAFIVRAANSHDQLVAALRKIAENARAAIDGGDALAWIDELHDIARDADKAVAAAGA